MFFIKDYEMNLRKLNISYTDRVIVQIINIK